MTSAWRRRPIGRSFGLGFLLVILLAGAALRLWLALHDDGLFWPDEIFQSLEPAHFLAFGYGLLPWEYLDGARSWALPGLVAGLLELCRAVGLTDPHRYVLFVRFFFCAVGVATAWASDRLARAFGAREPWAAIGAALFALAFPAVYFAPRAMSETACALPAALGFALVVPSGQSRRDRFIGASLLGLAVLLRLQAAIFCVAAVVAIASTRRWRPALECVVVLAGLAFADGLLDRLTWGDWFHSARVYLEFNLLAHGAARFGTAPFLFYGRVLWTSCGAAIAIYALLALASARRAPMLLLAGAAFFLVHSAIDHKEIRFILPFLPFLGASAGVGLQALSELTLGPVVAAGVGALALLSLGPAARLRGRTFAELGQGFAPDSPAIDFSGPVNRLLFAAGRLPDLCGLKVEQTHLAWTGGYAYLHRRVPLYYPSGPDRASGRFNYAVGRATSGGAIIAREGDQALLRLGGHCTPDPGYWAAFHDRRQLGFRDPGPVLRE
ncbi:MAG: glycosyltransferase family protein [Deltaproteobacteria bacterium]